MTDTSTTAEATVTLTVNGLTQTFTAMGGSPGITPVPSSTNPTRRHRAWDASFSTFP